MELMNLYLRMLLMRIRWSRGERLSVWDTGVTSFRVVPTDLDVLLHMNNGRYLTLMDLGRMDLMVRSGFWSLLSAKGWYPVAAGQTITYRKSLKLGQAFDLHTRLLGFDDRWTYVEQTFCVGDTIYASAVVRSRFLKKSGGSVENEELLKLVDDVPEDLVLPDWVHDWAESTRIMDPTFRPGELEHR